MLPQNLGMQRLRSEASEGLRTEKRRQMGETPGGEREQIVVEDREGGRTLALVSGAASVMTSFTKVWG